MVMPVAFLTFDAVQSELEVAPKYRKMEETQLRLIRTDEISKKFVSYILDENQTIQRETKNTMTTTKVVARNPIALDHVKDIYNEWLIEMDEVVENYGRDTLEALTYTFSNHTKIKPIKAIPITPAIMTLFKKAGAVDDNNLIHIMTPWGRKMKAQENDFLTEGGYSISKHDMKAYIPYREDPPSTSASSPASMSFLYNLKAQKPQSLTSTDAESTTHNLYSTVTSPAYVESPTCLHRRLSSSDSVSTSTSALSISSSSTFSPLTRGSISQSSFYSAFESPPPTNRHIDSIDFASFRLDNDDDQALSPVDDQKRNSNNFT